MLKEKKALEDRKAWESLFKKAGCDAKFLDRLLREGRKVCKEEGINVPSWVGLKFENHSKKLTAVITIGPLTKEQLQDVQGGGGLPDPHGGRTPF